jgi:hypothetical protein
MAFEVHPAEYRALRRLRRFVAAVCRLASRVFLAPLYAELNELRARQDRLEHQLHALLGRAWDQEATTRRLAAIENALIELREQLVEKPAVDSCPR